jgi:hypothetical protein
MKWLPVAVVLFLPAWAQAQSPLPDPRLTPGAINRSVSQHNIESTICVHDWTRRVRPSDRYTDRLKERQIAEYAYADRNPRHYEEDHLIPLDLGGSPASPRNLWPEPHLDPHQWGSRAKDRLEVKMLHLVCKRRLALNAARRMMASDWIATFKRFIGPRPEYHLRHRHRRPRSFELTGR